MFNQTETMPAAIYYQRRISCPKYWLMLRLTLLGLVPADNASQAHHAEAVALGLYGKAGVMDTPSQGDSYLLTKPYLETPFLVWIGGITGASALALALIDLWNGTMRKEIDRRRIAEQELAQALRAEQRHLREIQCIHGIAECARDLDNVEDMLRASAQT